MKNIAMNDYPEFDSTRQMYLKNQNVVKVNSQNLDVRLFQSWQSILPLYEPFVQWVMYFNITNFPRI